MTVWSIVVAAGAGNRFGGAKQFAVLAGRAVVDWSLAAARAASDGVVLVLPADGKPAGTDLGAAARRGADVAVAGGATRAASVRAGLHVVPPNAHVVVVHDAARPLASPVLFRAVVDAVSDGADGAVPVVPVTDTLKRVAGGVVEGTVDRAGLVAVQTPQAFRADALRRAHDLPSEATDDAALVEAAGGTVRVVPGDPRNLKITTAADLAIAEALVGR